MAISTAKSILRGYRKEGRIGPKITRRKSNNYRVSNPTEEKPVRNKYIISYKQKNSFTPVPKPQVPQGKYLRRKMR